MQSKYENLQNSDELNLQNSQAITGQLEPGEKIILSCKINKHNKYYVKQKRGLLITNRYIYNLSLDSKLTYLLSFIRSAAIIKRKIAVPSIAGITVSSQYLSDQFVIHVAKERDYRFSGVSKKRDLILKTICQQYHKYNGGKVPFYIKQEPDLSFFQTTDDDVKAGINRMPKEIPLLLSDEDLQLGLDYFIKLATQRAAQNNSSSFKHKPTDMNIDEGYHHNVQAKNKENSHLIIDKSSNSEYIADKAVYDPVHSSDLNLPYKATFEEPTIQTHTRLDFSSKFKFEDMKKVEQETDLKAQNHEYRIENSQPQMQPTKSQEDVYNTNPKGYPAPNFNFRKY